MADNNSISKTKLVLVSQDTTLASMAKGAIPSTNELSFEVINKPIGELACSLRDINASVLILDIDATSIDDFEHLQKINRQVGSQTSIIVITNDFSSTAARFLIQLKVTDFLVKPVQTSDLVRSCNNATKNIDEPAQVAPKIFSFMPASGGVGATSLAIETASILNKHGQKKGKSTCIVDLNFQHGTCAEYLDLEPHFDISEIENAPERLDRQLLDVMLSKHESGLSVISAPHLPTEMRSFKSDLVVRLLDLVSAYFDNVIIDLPRTWFPWTETVLAGSDKVFVIADMTVPSIRNSHRLVQAITDRIGNQNASKVLVNRMDFRKNPGGLNVSDVKEALSEYYGGGIPNNYFLVREAVDRGVTLCDVEQNNNVTEALSQLVLKNKHSEDKQETHKKGLLSLGHKLLQRKTG